MCTRAAQDWQGPENRVLECGGQVCRIGHGVHKDGTGRAWYRRGAQGRGPIHVGGSGQTLYHKCTGDDPVAGCALVLLEKAVRAVMETSEDHIDEQTRHCAGAFPNGGQTDIRWDELRAVPRKNNGVIHAPRVRWCEGHAATREGRGYNHVDGR